VRVHKSVEDGPEAASHYRRAAPPPPGPVAVETEASLLARRRLAGSSRASVWFGIELQCARKIRARPRSVPAPAGDTAIVHVLRVPRVQRKRASNSSSAASACPSVSRMRAISAAIPARGDVRRIRFSISSALPGSGGQLHFGASLLARVPSPRAQAIRRPSHHRALHETASSALRLPQNRHGLDAFEREAERGQGEHRQVHARSAARSARGTATNWGAEAADCHQQVPSVERFLRQRRSRSRPARSSPDGKCGASRNLGVT